MTVLSSKIMSTLSSINSQLNSTAQSGMTQLQSQITNKNRITAPITQLTEDIYKEANKLSKYSSLIYAGTPFNGVSSKVIKSIGNNAQYAGEAVGGLELLARNPSAIPTALVTGASGIIPGTVQALKNDPGQFASDLAVGAVLGYVSGKGVAKVSKKLASNTPAISRSKQEFYIKTKIAAAAETVETNPSAIRQINYKKSLLKSDVYNPTGKVQEIQSQVANVKPTQRSVKVLTGETKSGYTDVYVKVNKSQAAAVARKYSGAIENVRINKKTSAIVVDPLAELATKSKAGKAELRQIGTVSERVQIGQIAKSKKSLLNIKNPYRLEKKLTLIENELKASNSNRLLLPESTQTLEVDPIIKPDYKQLKSEAVRYNKKRSILVDDAGELFPQKRTKVKNTIIDDGYQENIERLFKDDYLEQSEPISRNITRTKVRGRENNINQKRLEDLINGKSYELATNAKKTSMGVLVFGVAMQTSSIKNTTQKPTKYKENAPQLNQDELNNIMNRTVQMALSNIAPSTKTKSSAQSSALFNPLGLSDLSRLAKSDVYGSVKYVAKTAAITKPGAVIKPNPYVSAAPQTKPSTKAKISPRIAPITDILTAPSTQIVPKMKPSPVNITDYDFTGNTKQKSSSKAGPPKSMSGLTSYAWPEEDLFTKARKSRKSKTKYSKYDFVNPIADVRKFMKGTL